MDKSQDYVKDNEDPHLDPPFDSAKQDSPMLTEETIEQNMVGLSINTDHIAFKKQQSADIIIKELMATNATMKAANSAMAAELMALKREVYAKRNRPRSRSRSRSRSPRRTQSPSSRNGSPPAHLRGGGQGGGQRGGWQRGGGQRGGGERSGDEKGGNKICDGDKKGDEEKGGDERSGGVRGHGQRDGGQRGGGSRAERRQDFYRRNMQRIVINNLKGGVMYVNDTNALPPPDD